MAKTTPNTNAKAPTKAKTSSVKKQAVKKTPTKSKSTKASGKKAAVSVAQKKKANVKTKVIAPLPKGWPVSSKMSYPPPTANDAPSGDDVMDVDADNTQPQSTPGNYLKPGNLLQMSCNGSDVFLRKRAVQSTSMAFPTTGEGAAAANKGAPTRFLIVFPGRMSLRAPEKVVALKSNNDGEDGPPQEDDEGKVTADDDEYVKDETKSKEDGASDVAASAKKARSPFAPANPPLLLGKLVSLGGDNRDMELRIPFPSAVDGDSNGDNLKHLVMSGRAIPLSGKYMTLSFKRTGGGNKDSSSKSTPKNKKMGTGSITCKDVFRSVIVLGGSKLVDDDGKEAGVSKAGGDVGDATIRHYGGSERTLDGGGKSSNGGGAAGRKNIGGSKRDSLGCVMTPVPSKRVNESDVESESDSERSDANDNSDALVDSSDSDGEFKLSSSKKRGSKSNDDGGEEVVSARKRTPRRSAAKAVNVSYVDEASEESEDDGSDSGESVGKSHSDEEVIPTKTGAKRKSALKAKPLVNSTPKNGSTNVTSRASKGAASAKKVSCLDILNIDGDVGAKSSKKGKEIVGIDSDSDDSSMEALLFKSRRSAKKVAPRKKPAATKKKVVAAPETEDGDSSIEVLQTETSAKRAASKKSTTTSATKKIASPNGIVSPRKRKKVSPRKTPTSRDDLNLSDDSFTFL